MDSIVHITPAPPTIIVPATPIIIVSILVTCESKASNRLNAVFHRSAHTASCLARSAATSFTSTLIPHKNLLRINTHFLYYTKFCGCCQELFLYGVYFNWFRLAFYNNFVQEFIFIPIY